MILKQAFVLWLVSAMNMMSPAHQDYFDPEAQESYEEADRRYIEIAEAAIDTAFDPNERPLFPGEYGRSRTAFFIVHKMYKESGFRRDMHYGIGRERLTEYNDHGRSWCMGQIFLGKRWVQNPKQPGTMYTDSANKTMEGWTGRQLTEDTNKCFRATKHMISYSFQACRNLPQDERLCAYATGNCNSKTGKEISRTRFESYHLLWQSSWSKHPKNKDRELMTELLNDPKYIELTLRYSPKFMPKGI